jgi:hypothetical protein
MTQVQQLKNHLDILGSISNVEAWNIYKIRARPRRISDLEAAGIHIKRVWKKDLTGQRYVRYVSAA